MNYAEKIDSLIAIVSPKKALQRQFFRERLAMSKRSETYAAAKTSRLTGTWLPTDTSPNPIIAASSPTVRARTRQLVRDFPVLSNAVDRLCDYTVGPGIQFQSKVKDRQGNLYKRRIQEIEEVNIGHSIVARALLTGMRAAVREMKQTILAA